MTLFEKLYKMKCKIILTLTAMIICFTVAAQGEGKLNRNFKFVVTGKLDTIASFSFEQRVKRSGWGDFSGALTQAFIAKGFRIINKETMNSIHSFSIVIDYGRGFFASKMQYFDLRGQIVDINKNSEVLGTFSYDGRFDPDDISIAIASALKDKNPVIVKEEEKKEIIKEIGKENPIQNAKPTKSKEERLIELKSLFEKGLITKEEYERAKQKILDEQ